MNPPDALDIAHQRRRLIRMAAINAVCVIVAVASAIGFVSFHIAWLGAAFAAAVLSGFATQVWLVLGLRRKR